jgi:hypothetical protein
MNLMRLVSFSLAVSLGLGIRASANDLVINGSFQAGDFNDWTRGGNTSYEYVGSDYLAPGNTTGTYGNLGPGDPIHFGNPNNYGWLYQTATNLHPGVAYAFSFWLAKYDEGSRGINLFQAYLGSGSSNPVLNSANVVYNWPGPVNDLGYYFHSFIFTANSATVSVGFKLQSDSSSFALDNIALVSQAPEPSSLAIAGGSVALMGAGCFWLRRRRQ